MLTQLVKAQSRGHASQKAAPPKRNGVAKTARTEGESGMRRHFRNASIIDASGAPPFRGTVTVEGNRIVAVTPSPAVAASQPDDEVIDCTGFTLLPGMTEAHCHISFNNLTSIYSAVEIQPEDHSLIALANAQLLLQRGWTSLFSAASAKPPRRCRGARRHQQGPVRRPAHARRRAGDDPDRQSGRPRHHLYDHSAHLAIQRGLRRRRRIHQGGAAGRPRRGGHAQGQCLGRPRLGPYACRRHRHGDHRSANWRR